MRRIIAAIVGALALVLTLIVVNASAAPVAKTYDSGSRTCTTNSTGYCIVTHDLGAVPDSVVVTPQSPLGGANIAGFIGSDSFTDTNFRVRVFKQNGSVFANLSVRFSYVATALPGTVPTTTVPVTTTPPITTTPPVTTPAPGCVYPSTNRACFPDATNTGVPAGVTLTTASSCSIDQNNAVVDAKLFNCDVTVNGTNVHITRSRIKGIVRNPGAGLVIDDSTIATDAPSIRNVAPIGQDTGDYTMQRVNMYNFQDGPRLSHGHTTITDSYVHDLAFATGEHPDGLQQYCPGCQETATITHNTFSGCAGNSTDKGSSGVFWSDNPGAGSLFDFSNNWVRCGQYTIRVNDTTNGSGVVADVRSNTVENGSWALGPCEVNVTNPFNGTDGVKWNNNILSTGSTITYASCQ